MSDVVICLFAWSGFDRAAQGVAGAGRRLADALEGKLHAILIGSPDESMTIALSRIADSVIVADQSELQEYQPELFLTSIAQLCKEANPTAVLLSNDAYSQEIAPRLAHRLSGSAVGDGVELKLHEGRLRVARSVYGGKANALIELKRSPAVVWIRSRAFDPAASSDEATAEVKRVTVDIPAQAATRIIERRTESSGEARLEDASIIVSGGRGLGGPEPFEQLKELAVLVGAQMAASRAACDSGWVPPSWQVGQTGKKVAPGLYVAVAISGASQHLAGISDAKTVAAINNDPDAPIFKRCRFGIVEDYRKVVPLLRDKLASMQK
jgi:electron transfer flavoprotein alpha subunit